MKGFVAALRGGDRRSIGRSDAAVAAVRRAPRRFVELWRCLSHADPLVRMRAADALEKLTRSDVAPLAPFKDALLSRAHDDGTAEVRWHLVAMSSRLPLDSGEASRLMAWLDRSLRDDPSRIVKVMALQAAAEVRSRHPATAAVFRRMLDAARASLWPSVRARARRLGN